MQLLESVSIIQNAITETQITHAKNVFWWCGSKNWVHENLNKNDLWWNNNNFAIMLFYHFFSHPEHLLVINLGPPRFKEITHFIMDNSLLNLSRQDLSEMKLRTLSQLYDYLSNLCNITFSADEVKYSSDERHNRYATFLIAMSNVALCYPSLERETVARIVAPLNTYQVSISSTFYTRVFHTKVLCAAFL